MLYEVLRMHFMVALAIFFGLGILGLIVATSIGKKSSRIEALVFSLFIFLAGFYFFYLWAADKAKIRILAAQIEAAFPPDRETANPAGHP